MLKHSPYYLTLITVFGPVIKFLFNSLDYIKLIDYVAVIIIVVLLITTTIKKGFIKKISPWLILWFVFLMFHLIYSISFIGQEISLALIGLYSYLIYFLYWYLFFNLYSKQFSYLSYFKFFIYLSVLIAIIAIYQYFVDLSLFGYASSINPVLALGKNFHGEIRVTSIFTSIQVFSCFIALIFIVLIDNLEIFKKYQNRIFLLLILFAGFLSGSKVFLLSILVGFIYYFFIKIKKYKLESFLIVILSLLMIIISYIYVFNSPFKQELVNSQSPIIRTVTPFFDINKFISQETDYETSRINVYNKIIFQNDSLILGHGLGMFNSIANKERPALESYTFQILMEVGLIGFIIFLIVLSIALFSKIYIISHKGLIIIMIILMSINQSFDSIVFFPFYCFIIFPLIFKLKNGVNYNDTY
jgi:hypothetical protein